MKKIQVCLSYAVVAESVEDAISKCVEVLAGTKEDGDLGEGYSLLQMDAYEVSEE